METSGDNFYARLGVSRDADWGEIRRAYHDAARRLHPDVNPDPRAAEVFMQIQEAYEVLSDPDQRVAYDANLPTDERDDSGVAIHALYSRSKLARITEPQLIYTLLEIEADPGDGLDEEPPLNVCLVLDCSTSMQGQRLDTLKTTAREIVRQFRSQDYLSIVTFSDRADVIVPATRRSNTEKIDARISLLQPGGSTEIYNGLKAGYFEVSRNLSPSYVNQMILITDGHTYGDEEDCLFLAQEAQEKGLRISALGLGAEWNDEFLDDLTGMTGGNSLYVSDMDDLKKFMQETFYSLGKVYAENLTLSFDTGPGFELKYMFRLNPDSSPLSSEPPISLGNVLLEEKLSILLEFLVSSVPDEAAVANMLTGSIKMNIPTRLVPTTYVQLSLERPTGPAIDPEPPPHQIVKAMSRLTLYRMQEQARQDLEDGNYEDATRRLQHLATHLLSRGESRLARTVLAEVDQIHRVGHLSENGQKRIKYGTRALLLPPQLQGADQ